MFVCNSNNSCYNIHSVLYILQLSNYEYFNIMYFNNIDTYLLYN